MKVFLIQNKPGYNKITNLQQINRLIKIRNEKEYDFIVLPECFNSPYGIKYFKDYAEELKKGNLTFDFLKLKSTQLNNKYIIAGSIPEKEGDKYYNTCSVWYNGSIICKYRKINLFDINIKGQVSFKESSVLSPGEYPQFFETKFGKIGLGICFDLRFNQLSNYYAKNNCVLIIYPGCFTEYTGKLHWKTLLKARALDSRCFIIGCATAKNKDMDYHSYGHSTIVEPMADIIGELDNEEGILICKLDLDKTIHMRNSIPFKYKEYL